MITTVGDSVVSEAKLCALPSASKTSVLRTFVSCSGVGNSFASGMIDVFSGAFDVVWEACGRGVDGTAGIAS
jgi:hypothetical protein